MREDFCSTGSLTRRQTMRGHGDLRVQQHPQYIMHAASTMLLTITFEPLAAAA